MSMFLFPASFASGYTHTLSTMSSIHGQLLEVTVVGCNKLKDTEWISKQDPYVCLEYASSKFRTRTCTDGHKDPVFQEKFNFNLIEGLRELNVAVWNSNTLSMDDFIGSGRVQLQKALAQGFDDTTWPLQTKHGRYAGEVRLIIHFTGTKISKPGPSPSASSYGAPNYGTQSPHFAGHYPPVSAYSSAPSPSPYPSPYPAAQPSPTAYPPSAYPPQPYPPGPAVYPPPQAYPHPPHSAYPPQTYPPPTSGYPPQTYPPAPYPSQPYEPSPYHSQGPYGTYPPPPF